MFLLKLLRAFRKAFFHEYVRKGPNERIIEEETINKYTSTFSNFVFNQPVIDMMWNSVQPRQDNEFIIWLINYLNHWFLHLKLEIRFYLTRWGGLSSASLVSLLISCNHVRESPSERVQSIKSGARRYICRKFWLFFNFE